MRNIIGTGTGFFTSEEYAGISAIIVQSCPHRGSERILLVDDEEQIALMLRQMLSHLGYQVTDTTSSLEALKIFSEKPDDYDLVITDQTMPDMTGFQLTRNIRQISPGIPVILCTGFSSGISEKKAKEAGISEFIIKPVAKKDLADALRRVLDANCAAARHEGMSETAAENLCPSEDNTIQRPFQTGLFGHMEM